MRFLPVGFFSALTLFAQQNIWGPFDSAFDHFYNLEYDQAIAELSQKLGFHSSILRFTEVAAANPALVRDDHQLETVLFQSSQRFARASGRRGGAVGLSDARRVP